MERQTRITGGRDGLKRAIHEAFYGEEGRCHNPAIKYSQAKGFVVESALTPDDDDVVWKHECNFFANTGDPNIKISDYPEIRREIIEEPIR